MNIYVFDIDIVLGASDWLCGSLLGDVQLHVGSHEGPWALLGAASGCLRAHGRSTDSMGAGFCALEKLLEAPLVGLRCPRDLLSLMI